MSFGQDYKKLRSDTVIFNFYVSFSTILKEI